MTGKYNKPGSREKRINMSRRRKNSAARQKRRLLIYGAAGIAAAAVIAITVPQLQKRQTAVYGETQLQRPESGSHRYQRTFQRGSGKGFIGKIFRSH